MDQKENQTVAIIRATDVTFAYLDNETEQKEAPVLVGLNLSIRKGEMVALLGHNGCGKSTIAKHFNSILLPDVGDVVVDGINTKDEDRIFDVRQRVGMVFQNPDNQLVATIVEEDVAFGPENLGIPLPELRDRVDHALETVGMTAYAGHEPHRLSGGQKQRIAIAGIIAMMPQCIVFDESTAMLDPSGRREVLETIKMLNRDHGITVLNITHYMDEAALADRVIVIHDGQLMLDGTPDEVFAQRALLRRLGLEVPQCTELIYRLKECGIPVEGEQIASPENCANMIARAYQKQTKKGGADRG